MATMVACASIVSADYFVQATFETNAACVAETPAFSAYVTSFTSACTVENSNSYRLACAANGDAVKMSYTGTTCSTTPSNSTGIPYMACAASGPFFNGGKCITGTFKPPVPMVAFQQFSDAQCNTPIRALPSPAQSSNLYTIGACVDLGATSAKVTCSGTKPTILHYNQGKCSGTLNRTESYSTDCVKDINNPANYVRYAPCESSSGAASTSVTFLALGLLVLATFSSAM